MDEEILELNILGDSSYANHLRAEENVKAWRDRQSTPVDLTAQSKAYLDMIRLQSEAGIFKTPTVSQNTASSALLKSMQDGRPAFESYNTSISDVYETLNSGALVPKYDSYIPGIDNTERLAKEQGTGEVWSRGLVRFGTQVGTSFFGNLAALPVGISEWINTGNFEATYDNDFTRMLDDVDRRQQLRNNIYYTQEEQSRSLWGGLSTSRFWADKVLGGASFTIGMLLSEGLTAAATGGLSLGYTGAKIGSAIARTGLARAVSKGNSLVANTARNASKLDDIIVGSREIQSTARWGNYGRKSAEVLNDIRFVVTSTGYEAGMEARHFRKDAEDQFRAYYEDLGVPMPEGATEKFREDLDNNSNKVFAANTAILSISNMALFGRMFGVGNTLRWATNTIEKPLNRRIFGIGTKEVSPGVFKALPRKTYQKVLSTGWNGIVKPTISEGFWEEGGQGIASNMMSEYMQSTYDPRVAEEVSSYTDAFFNSLAKQYGEKEGQEEVLIGAIIGTVFGGTGGSFTAGSRAAKRQVHLAKQQTKVAQAPALIAEALYTQENLLSHTGAANRNLRLEESVEESTRAGDVVEATLKSEAMIISALQAAHEIGKDGSFIEVLTGIIEGMDSQRLMEEFGLESITDVSNFKADKIEALNKINKQYSQNRTTAETYIGRGIMPKEFRGKESFLVDALAYSLTMNQSAERVGYASIKTIRDVFESLKDSASSETIDALGMFALSDAENVKNYNTYREEHKVVNELIEEAVSKLRDLQNSERASELLNEIESAESELKRLHNRAAELESLLEGVHNTMESRFFEELGEVGVVSREVLDDLEGYLSRSEEAVSALESISPEAYNRVLNAFRALDQAVEYSQQFSEINKSLLSGNINTKMTNNIFGKLLSDTKTLNDETFEALLKISKIYLKDSAGIVLTNESILTSEDWTEFKKTGEVSQELIDSLAVKISEDKVLTAEEQEIYESKASEVDVLIRDNTITRIVNKVNNRERLTAKERVFQKTNYEAVREALNDPLRYSKGEPIVDKDKNISQEVRQLIKWANRLEGDSTEVSKKIADKVLELVERGSLSTTEGLYILDRFELSNTAQAKEIGIIERSPSQQSQLRKLRNQLLNIFRMDRMKRFGISRVTDMAEISDELIEEFLELVEKQRTNNSLSKAERARLRELEESATLTESEAAERAKLIEKSRQGGLKVKELERLEEIEDIIEQYNVLQGTEYEGISVLEIMKMYNQIKNATQSDVLSPDEITEAEYVEIVSTDHKGKEYNENERRGRITQVTEYVLSRFLKGGVQLFHMQLDDLIDRIEMIHPTARVVIEGNILNLPYSQFNGISGTTVTIILEDGSEYSLRIPEVKGKKGKKVGSPITITSASSEFNLEDLTGLKAMSVEGQKGNYYLVYENLGEEVSPVRSSADFRVTNDSGTFFDEEAARSVKPGDRVELVFDYTDSYNQTLPEKDLIKEANIYVMKDGKIVGRLKSTIGNSNADGLHDAREAAVTKGKVTVEVYSVLSGIPIIQMQQDGSKKLQPINPSDVVSQGYIEDGLPNIEIPSGTTVRYIQAASRMYKGRKVPFVIIRDKVSDRLIAFPVEVSNTNSAMYTEELSAILQETDSTAADKAIRVNQIILSSGIGVDSFWANTDNIDNQEFISDLQAELEGRRTLVDLEDFTNTLEGYDIATVVDFENNTMTSPKFVLDFDTVEESKSVPKIPEPKGARKSSKRRQRLRKRNKKSAEPTLIGITEVESIKQAQVGNTISYRLPIGGGVQYGTLLENGNVLNDKGEELYASVLRDVAVITPDLNSKLEEASKDAANKCK